jgi:hypothetical protein
MESDGTVDIIIMIAAQNKTVSCAYSTAGARRHAKLSRETGARRAGFHMPHLNLMRVCFIIAFIIIPHRSLLTVNGCTSNATRSKRDQEPRALQTYSVVSSSILATVAIVCCL